MGLAQTTLETDQGLGQRVHRSLGEIGYPQLRAVRCDVQSKTVVLRGELRSFYLKQVAQTIALRVAGVHRVVNRIEVVTSPE